MGCTTRCLADKTIGMSDNLVKATISDNPRSGSSSPMPGLTPNTTTSTTDNVPVPASIQAQQQAPFCHITLKCTKEVAGYNTISEAFYRLDFCNAIRDIRRFNYVSKLLHLLINQNLTSLSGCATKVLFSMLEQVAWQGAHFFTTQPLK